MSFCDAFGGVAGQDVDFRHRRPALGDAGLRRVAGNRVQPINTALGPSWSKIDPACRTCSDCSWVACIAACPGSGPPIGPIHVADAAQYQRSHRPERSITSPCEQNEDQDAAAPALPSLP